MARLTPKEAADKCVDFPRAKLSEVDEWIQSATIEELQIYIHWLDSRSAGHWFERARVALELLLAKEAATHASQLSEQTAELIKESQALTKYTLHLRTLTVALVVFAVVQIVIMVIDFIKHV